jgi:hypothetical protein
MAKSKSDKERERISQEFEQIQSEGNEYDISNHLARPEDLPDLGEIELYDYDSDLTVASEQSMGVLESLVDLYLDDVPQLKEHPYIKNKMNEDALVYAEALFLAKMTRKNLLEQMKQVDNGDNSARMHEVVNQTVGQIRENSKFLSNQRSELEKFYKNLRVDLGLDDIEAPVKSGKTTDGDNTTDKKDDGEVLDNRALNEMIKKAMTGDDKKKKK